MNLRPYQTEAITAIKRDWATHHDVLLVMATGGGKAQPLTAHILTPHGWTAMGDLAIGDAVIGSDGLPHAVSGIFPQGEIDAYRVRFSDGTMVECCADHLWAVQTKSQKLRGSDLLVRPLHTLIGDLNDGSGARKWFVPIVRPVAFAPQPIPLDPYVLGVLIGDGNLYQVDNPETGGSAISFVRVTSADQFIVDELTRRLEGIATLRHLYNYDYSVTSGRTGRRGSPVANALRSLGLMGRRSHEKFIPAVYLYNDIGTRVQLLRGLMDTDGEGRADGKAAIFNTSSHRLAEDVCELVRSLGGITQVRRKAPGRYTHNGEKRIGRESYRVTVSLPFNPFLLPRKDETYNPDPKQGRTKAITAIEPIGKQACQCILINSTDHLYVTDGYTLTHNTQCFLQLAMDALDAQVDARCLVIAHRAELIDQPVERVRQMNSGWLTAGALDKPRIGVVMADRNDCDRQLTIATIQTLSSEKRLARLLSHGAISHLIIDECHHACARTYLTLWEKLRAANPELRHLGVTATPLRSDGDGLSRVYSHVSARITIADLVREHYLVQPRWLGISTGISLQGVKTQNGDFAQGQLAERFDTDVEHRAVVQAYQEYAAPRRSIAFTASVRGAHDLADQFRAAGISACAVDGTTPKDERRRLMDGFRRGQYQILTNCQVATEGFDAPGASCVLMCRPTKSDSLYVQMMGRGLRPAGGDPMRPGMAIEGEDCVILDFLPADTRNIVMAGDVLGLPKEVTREVTRKQTEPGEVQAGFTFDGMSFNTDGTPLEIVARQLDYLSSSPFVWYRKDGWLTLGLGEASDNNERILAIAPDGPPWKLYGMLRKKGSWDWRSKLIAQSADLAELGDEGNRIAGRWGSGALIGKGRGWHDQGATEGQRNWLYKLARGVMRSREIDMLSKGECASLITHFQAVRYLDRASADALYRYEVTA